MCQWKTEKLFLNSSTSSKTEIYTKPSYSRTFEMKLCYFNERYGGQVTINRKQVTCQPGRESAGVPSRCENVIR